MVGYTLGMKSAVSIPDDLFEQADRLARRSGKSRSQLYSDALRDYLARHAPDEVTQAMDRVLTDIQQSTDPFVSRAARRILDRVEW